MMIIRSIYCLLVLVSVSSYQYQNTQRPFRYRRISSQVRGKNESYASLESRAIEHEKAVSVLEREVVRLRSRADKDKKDEKKVKKLEGEIEEHEKQVDLNMAKAERALIEDALDSKKGDSKDKAAEDEIQKLDEEIKGLGWKERKKFSHHHHHILQEELEAMEEHENSEYEADTESHHHALGLVVCALYLILWTLVFNYLVKSVNRYVRSSGMPELGEVVNVLTDDLAAFGFTTVILFILIRGRVPEKVGDSIMPNEHDGEEFVEMLEFLDFSLFGMLIVYALIIIILLLLAMRRTRKWRRFEKQCHRDQRRSLRSRRIDQDDGSSEKEDDSSKKKDASSEKKDEEGTSSKRKDETNLAFALKLRSMAESDQEFHDYLSCRTMFLCGVRHVYHLSSHHSKRTTTLKYYRYKIRYSDNHTAAGRTFSRHTPIGSLIFQCTQKLTLTSTTVHSNTNHSNTGTCNEVWVIFSLLLLKNSSVRIWTMRTTSNRWTKMRMDSCSYIVRGLCQCVREYQSNVAENINRVFSLFFF